jgi:hypothetical protein
VPYRDARYITYEFHPTSLEAMIELKHSSVYLISCDCCGAKASDYFEEVHKARKAADQAGYKFSSCVMDGCYREWWVCPACFAKTAAKPTVSHLSPRGGFF